MDRFWVSVCVLLLCAGQGYASDACAKPDVDEGGVRTTHVVDGGVVVEVRQAKLQQVPIVQVTPPLDPVNPFAGGGTGPLSQKNPDLQADK